VSAAGFFVPGRIEVLGKHTDYGGGRSLLCAMEQGFTISATPRADDQVRIVDLVAREARTVRLDPLLTVETRDWSVYIATVVRRIARNFPRARTGADITFSSNLPPASGMSSSSALMTGIFLALDAVNDIAGDPAYRAAIDSAELLAGYLGTIENGQDFGSLTGDRGAGAFGGSEDHTAILCSIAGHLRQYAFCPVRAERTICFPADRVFVVAFSGVAAVKTGGARDRYNEAALAARALVDLWNSNMRQSMQCLADVIDSAPDASDQLQAVIHASSTAGFSRSRLSDRLAQFMTESYAIIPRAGDALADRDYGLFGTLVDRSQHAAEALLGNQVPETVALARLARELGADAASAFGAGFGGSVWAMVPASAAESFATAWQEAYSDKFPEAGTRSEFIVTRPGPPATAL
jgi:galactokinase